MGKYLLWILLGIIAAVVFVLAFNYVREHARPMIYSPAELERMERGTLTDTSTVVVTLDDNRFHRPGCPEIYGVTERITYRAALSKGVRPCPVCVGEERRHSEDRRRGGG